ncbi:MAG: hypothetical protein JWN18_250 [Parcubacteria group bacterium]|nr:hypothetical protein [Parcubacteria group bacterium]
MALAKRLGIIGGATVLVVGTILLFSNFFPTEYRSALADVAEKMIPLPSLDRADYDARMLRLAHVSSTTATSTRSIASTTLRKWPVHSVYPDAGAILPFKRIVAYYGNFYSRGMGVLGEYPTDQMLAMLDTEVKKWTAADPGTPVVPAIHYIAVVAQGTAGREGKWILRMPDDQIDHAIDLAARIGGIVILDVQVGQSTVQHEIPLLEKYLKMPNVHLGLDPEFSMKNGEPPGSVIGTMDASDINFTAQYLAKLVTENKLPPKVLIVHRFTGDMLTNYKQIQPLPQVQIVVDMDGYGSKAKKIGTYTRVVAPQPVQFTGVKLFYKNDTRPPADGLLSPSQLLNLTPAPSYIQYQ